MHLCSNIFDNWSEEYLKDLSLDVILDAISA